MKVKRQLNCQLVHDCSGCFDCDQCEAIGPCMHCSRSCIIIKKFISDDIYYILDDD
jgi:hypothetical protein